MTEQHNEREAAIESAMKDVVFAGGDRDSWEFGFTAGFEAGWHHREPFGAASVDRVEIVREAFADFEVEVNDGRWKSGWRSTEEIKRAMDALIAAMEKGK